MNNLSTDVKALHQDTLESKSPFTDLIVPVEAVWDGKLCTKKAIMARNLYLKMGLDSRHYSRWAREQILTNDFLKESADFCLVAPRGEPDFCGSQLDKKMPKKTPDIALRVSTAKFLLTRLNNCTLAKACWDYLDHEIQAAYDLQRQHQIRNIDITQDPVFIRAIAAATEAVRKEYQKALDAANNRATEHHKRLLIATDDARGRKKAKDLRADIVNLVRSIARLRQDQTADSYERIYNEAYSQLMRQSFYPWKSDFWASKNKLDFLQEQGKDKLERLKIILESWL